MDTIRIKRTTIPYTDPGIQVDYTDNSPVAGFDSSIILNDDNDWNTALLDGSTLAVAVTADGSPVVINQTDSTTWVDTSTVGTYVITFTFTDDSGNTSQKLRTVIVEENSQPVITLNEGSSQDVKVGGTYVERGAVVTDADDPVDYDNLVINATAVNTSVIGSYSVTYDYTDPNGLAATQVIRTVNVFDAAAALTLTLLGDNPLTITNGEEFIEPGYEAYTTSPTASVEPLTSSVVISGDIVNTSVSGTYIITYSVTDNYGESTTAQRTVIVSDYIELTDTATAEIDRKSETFFKAREISRNAAYTKDLSMTNHTMVADKDNLIQNVYNIIFTSPGERWMFPEFGCRINTKVFNLMDDEIESDVLAILKEDIERFETRVQVDTNTSSVEIIAGNILNIYLTLILPATTATIGVVVEQ